MVKPVLNVRANLHKCKMKLLPVWSPRLCDASRFVEHIHDGGNPKCRVVPLSRLEQTRCRRHDVSQLIHTVSRRSSGVQTVRNTRSIEIPVTQHKLFDDTVGSVRCGHEGLQTARTTVLQPYFYTREERLDGATKPTQEQNKQRRVSQIGETWRDTSEKLISTKSYVAPELIMCGSAEHSQSTEGAEISRVSRPSQ